MTDQIYNLKFNSIFQSLHEYPTRDNNCMANPQCLTLMFT